MKQERYTIGQLAGLTKTSVKAIRVYEQKGLLVPHRDPENHYRYFDEGAIVTLQRIQMLRYLGFSLDAMKQTIRHYSEMNLTESFSEQKRLLEKKAYELERMIYCMDRAIIESQSEEFEIDSLFDALHAIIISRKADEGVYLMQGHGNEPEGWSRWIFEHAGLFAGDRILDAGCGFGNLWRCNADRYPAGMRVTLVDFHNTHADELYKFVSGKPQFRFCWGDINTIRFKDKFDCIFFNHVIAYMKEPVETYRKLAGCLSGRGKLIATWGGLALFEELAGLLGEYRPQNKKAIAERLRGVREMLARREEELNEVFHDVRLYKYPLTLTFETEAELAGYLEPFACELGAAWSDDEAFAEYLKRVYAHGVIRISRDAYLYVCKSP